MATEVPKATETKAATDAEAARRGRLRTAGRASTIATGGLGDTSAASVAARTLLGTKQRLGQ